MRVNYNKISFLINDLKAGGAEKQMVTLAISLKKMGFDISVITIVNRGIYRKRLEENGISLHSLNVGRVSDFPLALIRLKKILNKIKPDILHTFLFYSDILSRIISLVTEVPLLVNSMRNVDDWRKNYHIFIDRYTSFLADKIVSNTIAGGKRLVKIEKIPHEKISIIHNGIENKIGWSKVNLREEFNIAKDIFLVGSVGRLHKQKNFPLLILSFKKFKDRYKESKLLIIGDGPERKYLESVISDNDLEDSVILVGERENIVNIIYVFDLFVVSSDYEGLPNVIMEAALNSLPVISTDVGGVNEIIKNKTYGLTVPKGNVEELSSCMEKFYIDESYRKKCGKNLNRLVLDRFSVKKMVDRHLELYDKLIKEKYKKNLKILYIITKSDRGGAQKNVADLAVSMNKKGYYVSVAAGVGNELLEYLTGKNINTYFISTLDKKISPFKDFISLLHIIKIVRSQDWDIIHCHSSKAGILGRIAGKLNGIPTIYTAHGFVFYDEMKPVKKNLYILIEKIGGYLSDGIITVSKKDKEKALSNNIGRNKPVKIIENGIDLENFEKNLLPRNRVRNLIDIDDKTILIGTIGRLCEDKGFDILIEAVSIIKKKISMPFRLAIMGDGDLKSDLDKLIVDKRVNNEVKIYDGPEKNELPYRGFDIYVISSRKEGCPYTLIEAGAASLPVVATNTGSIPDIIENGKSGIVVSDNSPETLANEIVKILKLEENLRKKMGDVLNKKIGQFYTLDGMIRKSEEFYIDIIKNMK